LSVLSAPRATHFFFYIAARLSTCILIAFSGFCYAKCNIRDGLRLKLTSSVETLRRPLLDDVCIL
jgi:hypothetical protein